MGRTRRRSARLLHGSHDESREEKEYALRIRTKTSTNIRKVEVEEGEDEKEEVNSDKKCEEDTKGDDVNNSSESKNKEDEQLGEADHNEEELNNGDVSCDEVLTAADSADNKKTQESERTSIICTNKVKVVLNRLSQDRILHQIKRSVSQQEEEEEPNSLDTPLSETETDINTSSELLPVADKKCEEDTEGDDVNNSSEIKNKEDEQLGEADHNEEELNNGDVSCDEVLTAADSDDNKKTQDVSGEPLEEPSQHAEEQKDPPAADEDPSKAASTDLDSSLVEEDEQEQIRENNHGSTQNLEEIPPTTVQCNSSPADLMEPHTSEKEDVIADVEKSETLDTSTKSSVELENSTPLIISPEIKTPELNTSLDQTCVGEGSTHMEEDQLTNVTESLNVDGMDLNQLQKEKIKMQLKVLRMQEEYYRLKMRKLNE